MTALAALVLVDRGELDLDATVAAYWPEFAARGKAGIKVRHLLSHTSGVSGWEQPLTLEDLYDWDDRIFEVQSDGIDLAIGIPFKFGIGYSLPAVGRVRAGGGTGGSTVIIDVDRRITFAYVMNKIAPEGATIAPALPSA